MHTLHCFDRFGIYCWQNKVTYTKCIGAFNAFFSIFIELFAIKMCVCIYKHNCKATYLVTYIYNKKNGAAHIIREKRILSHTFKEVKLYTLFSSGQNPWKRCKINIRHGCIYYLH